jgi:serine/threonine protein phosphatase 1
LRRFAISDLHGCSRTFRALIDRIALTQADELYLLGDYIDRGPDSRGVIDTIWQLQRDGYTVRCLRGNHEELLLDAPKTLRHQLLFEVNGGVATMASFGVAEPDALPAAYVDWMRELPSYFEVGEYLLVHAGFNFGLADPFASPQDMAWIRGWYDAINRDWLGDRYIVHGHTPVDELVIRRQLEDFDRDRVLDIDNGCVFAPAIRESAPGGKGQLCAFDLTNRRLYFEANREGQYDWR